MAEEQVTAQAQNSVAGAATRMKKDGMSTKDIMVVLFQSKLTASNQLTSLTDVILVDAQAAQVKAKLKELVTTHEKDIRKTTQAIQAEVEFIGNNKSTSQFQAVFNQQFTPMVEQHEKLVEERKKLNEQCKQVIKQLHDEIKNLNVDAGVNQQAFLSQIRPIKSTVDALNKSTQRLSEQNTSLLHSVDHLHRDTSRVAATVGGFKPAAQMPGSEYTPESPD